MLQSIEGWLEILDPNQLSIVPTVVLLVDIRKLPRLLDVSTFYTIRARLAATVPYPSVVLCCLLTEGLHLDP